MAWQLGLRRWRIIDALGRGLLAGLVLAAGMPQARAATLLTWDITTTGTTTGNTRSGGANGSPSNTWNRTYVNVKATATESLAAGCFIEWTTTASPGYTVTFNGLTAMNLAKTTTGPDQAALFYSTDGGLVQDADAGERLGGHRGGVLRGVVQGARFRCLSRKRNTAPFTSNAS